MGCLLYWLLLFVVCCLRIGGWCLVFGVFVSAHCHWLLVVGCNTSFMVCCVLFVCEWPLVVAFVC